MAITPEGVVKLEQQVYEEPILPRMDLTQQVPGYIRACGGMRNIPSM